MHRYQFQKSKISKHGDNRTAKEIMWNMDMYRIYDCGSYKYEMIL